MTKKKDLSLREKNDDANRQASMDYIHDPNLVLTEFGWFEPGMKFIPDVMKRGKFAEVKK